MYTPAPDYVSEEPEYEDMYYFVQHASAEQHELFGQLQLSPQHEAQSVQQQEADFCVASVFVAKKRPAAPSISAAAAIKRFFFIVVFPKINKCKCCVRLTIVTSLLIPSIDIRHESAIRTLYVV